MGEINLRTENRIITFASNLCLSTINLRINRNLIHPAERTAFVPGFVENLPVPENTRDVPPIDTDYLLSAYLMLFGFPRQITRRGITDECTCEYG